MQTIAIQSPGDMGHAIGQVLARAGHRVIAALDGRSARTRGLAQSAGIEDVGPPGNLFGEAELVFSIMRPDRALELVDTMAALARTRGHGPVLVDLNAVAPSTAREAARRAAAAGLAFVDGGIIGGPPRPPGFVSPRLYVSGPGGAALASLSGSGLDIRVVGKAIGAASATKMCYAALTKGLTAIAIQSMVTARLEGVEEAFVAELAGSQQGLLALVERGLPGMCPKAYRWVGEMEEISTTHSDAGLPGEMFQGAARIYEMVEHSPLGAEVVEDRRLGTDATAVARILAEYVSAGPRAAD